MLEILYYIFIFPLESLLSWILGLLDNITDSKGLAIVLLALFVNIFLLKIFIYTDNKALKESTLKKQLDKRIKSWKQVYKRAKIYAFTRTLYRQNHYHPIFALRSLGGLLIQIPFFYAMYFVIKHTDELNHTSFLWIDDLSKPDMLNIFGLNIHILPILMTIFTLINVMISSKEKGARIQGIIITLIFLLLLYDMPSSLVLYWTSNMLFALCRSLWNLSNKYSCKVKPKQSTQENMDCHANPCGLARNDETNQSHEVPPLEASSVVWGLKGNNGSELAIQAPLSPLKKDKTKDSIDYRKLILCHNSKDSCNDETNHDNKALCHTEAKDEISTNTKQKHCSLSTLFHSIFTPYYLLDSRIYKMYKNISIFALLNICFMVFVFSPFSVYSSDVSQFDSSQTYQTLGALFGYFLLWSFLLIYITSFFYKTRLFKLGVYGVSVVLVIGVVYGFILTGDYGALDHFIFQNPTFMNIDLTSTKYLYFILVCFVSCIFVFLVLKHLNIAFKILFLTLVLMSIWHFGLIVNYLVGGGNNAINSNNSNMANVIPYEKELFSYSKEKNIVIFVLDMFSGSHTPYIFEHFKEYNKIFDGFTLFPNTLSTTNSTIHSIATLIGGEYWTTYNMNARKDNLKQSINRAFGEMGLNFANNGYDVAYFLNTGEGSSEVLKYAQNKIFAIEYPSIFNSYFIQNNHHIATQIAQIQDSTPLHKDIIQLYSLGLFRFAPDVSLRPRIYNNGMWLLDNKDKLNALTSIIYSSSFYAFTHLGNINSPKPTFKFFHSLMTHMPYGMYFNDNQCKFFAKQSAWNDYHHNVAMSYLNKTDKQIYFQHYDTEICALSYLASYIQWLKDNNIYDNTQIFVVSDHSGNDSINIPIKSRPDALFLFKDFGAKGDLRIDNRLMANFDIASIFCENLPNGCQNMPKNILKNYPNNRSIIHTIPTSWMINKHKSNQWILDKAYRVKDNIYKSSNWSDESDKINKKGVILD